jgi:hypothetical protein
VKDGATIGSDNLAEMEKVLGSPSLIEQTEHEGNDDPNVQLKIANSVWTNDLKDSFWKQFKPITMEKQSQCHPDIVQSTIGLKITPVE